MKKRVSAMLLTAVMFFCLMPQSIVSAQEQYPRTITISVDSKIKAYNSPLSAEDDFEEYIVDSIVSCDATINLTEYDFDLDETIAKMNNTQRGEYINAVYPRLDLQLFANKYPELYNLRGWEYVISRESGYEGSVRYYISGIKATYHFSQDAYINRNNAFKSVATSMVADLVDSDLTDLEKALILHDRLAIHCEYDYENYENGTVPADSYNMYGALVNKIAVCQGYSKAYMYMLGLLGIESRVCTSEKLMHMWNIVTIDGEEYHVDVTGDDPVYNIEGRVNHDNFLRSSVGIYYTNHRADDFDMTPDDTKYDNYFWQKSKTAFQYVDGSIYYVDNSASDIILWDGEDREVVWDIHNRYNPHIKLNSYKNNLYYTFDSKVYCIDLTDDATAPHVVSAPKMPYGYDIYGFNIVKGELLMECYSNPNGGEPYIIIERIEDEVDITDSFDSALKSSLKSFTYDGKKKTLDISVSAFGELLQENRDYTTVYKSNVNAGTAMVTLTAENGYTGTASATFTIKPASLGGATVSNIYDKEYTGKAVTQNPIVYRGGKLLQPKADYNLSYSSNTATGKAKVKITATGNYTGTVTKYFYIHPKKVTGLKFSSATASKIKIKWSKSPSGTGYAVRRKTSKNGKYKTVAIINSLKTTSYTDKTVKANKTYYYDVVAFKTVSGKKYGGVASKLLTTKTATATPKISYYKNNSSKKAKIKWKKVSGTTKYKLYMSTKKGSGYKCVYTGKKLSYTKSKLKKGKTYYFKVRTYKTLGGKKIYSSYSSVKKVKIKK